jgi:hypothetical protein
MVTLGEFNREVEKGNFFITTKNEMAPDQLAVVRKLAESANLCDESFERHRSFALFGPDGSLLDNLAADNELDAVHEGFMSLGTECDVSEVEPIEEANEPAEESDDYE